jgi:hypothetical protein
MSDELPAASMPTPEERDRVTAELCDHFAAGHIELDVLEQRLAEVDTAESQGQLVKLVGDLPGEAGRRSAGAGGGTGGSGGSSGSGSRAGGAARVGAGAAGRQLAQGSMVAAAQAERCGGDGWGRAGFP